MSAQSGSNAHEGASQQEPKQRTAAVLVIGNEVLTGKVKEANVAVVARLFFELGIALRRVVVCIDDVDVIAEDLRTLKGAHDVVVTSGGIGPTHDDLTVEGVAAAFGRPVVRSEEMATMLRAHHQKKGYKTTDAHLRMADLVEGARLLRTKAHPWPTMVVDNVYVLPGVPEIFRLKMPLLRKDLDQGQRLFSQPVYTRCREGDIAALLEGIEARFPGVSVGSYLAWDHAAYSVKVTFDSADEQAGVDAAQVFIDAIGDKFVGRELPSV